MKASALLLLLAGCGAPSIDVALYGEHVATLDRCSSEPGLLTAWAPSGEALLVDTSTNVVQLELVGGRFAGDVNRRWAGPPAEALQLREHGFRVAFADQYGLELRGAVRCE